MTEPTNPFAAPAAAKKPGRPAKKPAAAAPPVERTLPPQRLAPKPSLLSKMKARPNWDDDSSYSVAEEGVDRLRIPPELVQQFAIDGVALQWITKSVRGMEMPQEQAKFVKGGWTPVYQTDFDGAFDGLFMPKGQDDVIVVDDCMLVARPMAVQRKARQHERALAREPLMIKEAAIGQGIAVTGGDHPTARAGNKISRSLERVEIPE